MPIQQLIKALRKLPNSGGNCGDLMKSIKHVVAASATNKTTLSPAAAIATSLLSAHTGSDGSNSVTSTTSHKQQQYEQNQQLKITNSSQQNQLGCQTSQTANVSLILHLNENSSAAATAATKFTSSTTTTATAATNTNATTTQDSNIINTTTATPHHLHRSQQIQNFYQQQLHHFHTQHNQSLYAKQKQTQANAMSSLAAEPLTLSNSKQDDCHSSVVTSTVATDVNAQDEKPAPSGSSTGKPCFNTGFSEILQFMELIGNLKHTKRTGWVLRDVNDCESISGHMYRMSMMTFLLDGSEGLNQIRCMELALVHDLAESLVGDITPFCGISKADKRTLEFKAMEDICKLIEPRGKRMMELFEEYEDGKSAESRFVKDLDRLDMVMQAFEYEKRDNCLLKHQEFFDSTAGKFNHPFVKKLVDEIYEQRGMLAKAKGATPPPAVHVPSMELPTTAATNGHAAATAAAEAATNSSSSSS